MNNSLPFPLDILVNFSIIRTKFPLRLDKNQGTLSPKGLTASDHITHEMPELST
jgi:hypothetical protein